MKPLLRLACWIPIIGISAEMLLSSRYENYLSDPSYPWRFCLSMAYHSVALVCIAELITKP
jgi:hypothetical protein